MTETTFLTAHCPKCHGAQDFAECGHAACPRCITHGAGEVTATELGYEPGDLIEAADRTRILEAQVHNLPGELEDRLIPAAQDRAERLVTAEATLAGQVAEIEHLKARCVALQAQADVAEQVANRLRTDYPRESWLPGDTEPPDDEIVRVVVRLQDGTVYRRVRDGWRPLWTRTASTDSWSVVLEGAPVVDITGWGSERLVKALADEREAADQIRSALWDFERDVLRPDMMAALGLERDRERAGSVEEARAILRNGATAFARLGAAYR